MTERLLAAGVVDDASVPTIVALVLRSDRLSSDGRALPTDPAPLDTIEVAGWRPGEDLSLVKPCSDLVVGAVAHAPGGRPTARMEVVVDLPERGHRVALRVVGDRRCSVSVDRVEFSPPTPFLTMPIEWSRAYGGTDATAELDDDVDALQLALLLGGRRRWGEYPRNPLGLGWRVGPGLSRLDGVALPNLEDPQRALRPEDLPVASVRAWAKQPVPRCFGWVDPAWFPRCAHAASVPDVDDPRALELVGGSEAWDPTPRSTSSTARLLWSGASLGLAVAPLHGGEILRTLGLDPEGEFLLRLPTPPRDGAGRGFDDRATRWNIHTCAIDLPGHMVHTVWRGAVPIHGTAPGDSSAQRREQVRAAIARWAT